MDEPAPHHLAADADRERTVASLRTAVSEGRLTLAEFDARAAEAYASRTYGDLVSLTRDLPATTTGLGMTTAEGPGPVDRRVARSRRAAARGRGPSSPPARRPVPLALWGVYLSANLACFTVWLLVALTGGGAEPWFLWVAGPWGAVLLGQEIRGRLR